MKGWLRRRLSAVPIHLALCNDGMVVSMEWRAGWLSGDVRMAPDDARVFAAGLLFAANAADRTAAEAIL